MVFITLEFQVALTCISGVVLAATGSATDFRCLAAARFFLGVFESCLNPGFVLIFSSWWKREEQAARIGLWYSAKGLASLLAGVLFWAIAHINVCIERQPILFLTSKANPALGRRHVPISVDVYHHRYHNCHGWCQSLVDSARLPHEVLVAQRS